MYSPTKAQVLQVSTAQLHHTHGSLCTVCCLVKQYTSPTNLGRCSLVIATKVLPKVQTQEVLSRPHSLCWQESA
jgi:hypothetical protein